MRNEDFFSILGHLSERTHGEDQLSNTFRACFNFSNAFKECVLKLLIRTCRTRHKLKDLDNWECVTQLSKVSQTNISIHDICLRQVEANGRLSSVGSGFILESKVGACLNKSQLKRYTRRTKDRLVAVTKHYPEVSPIWMKRRNVAAVRWQDFHRCLSQSNQAPKHERFLVDQFLIHLEAQDMAYGEIYREDLAKISWMFQRIGKHSKDHITINFSAAAHCLQMLDDVRRDMEDALPKLADKKNWHRWGPGYYAEEYTDVTSHNLAFGWWKRKSRGVYPGVYLGITFQEKDNSRNALLFGWEDSSENYVTRDMNQFFDKQSRLDRDKLRKAAILIGKRWAT